MAPSVALSLIPGGLPSPSATQLRALGFLESLRDLRLCDCPYVERPKISKRLLTDAGLSEDASWEEVARVARRVRP